MSTSVLPLDIVKVEHRFGLKLPISLVPSLIHKDELRVNVPSFIHWCDICVSQRAHHYCKTENRYTCSVCNEFCNRMVHKWEKTWETIGVMG